MSVDIKQPTLNQALVLKNLELLMHTVLCLCSILTHATPTKVKSLGLMHYGYHFPINYLRISLIRTILRATSSTITNTDNIEMYEGLPFGTVIDLFPMSSSMATSKLVHDGGYIQKLLQLFNSPDNL